MAQTESEGNRLISESNPYSAPQVTYEPKPRTGGSNLRSLIAVLLGGGVVDFLGTAIAINLLILALDGLLGAAEAHNWYFSTFGQVVGMLIGCAFSFLGALTAAFVAGRRPVIHALLSLLVAHLIAIPIWHPHGFGFDSPIRLIGMAACLLVAVAAGKLVAK